MTVKKISPLSYQRSHRPLPRTSTETSELRGPQLQATTDPFPPCPVSSILIFLSSFFWLPLTRSHTPWGFALPCLAPGCSFALNGSAPSQRPASPKLHLTAFLPPRHVPVPLEALNARILLSGPLFLIALDSHSMPNDLPTPRRPAPRLHAPGPLSPPVLHRRWPLSCRAREPASARFLVWSLLDSLPQVPSTNRPGVALRFAWQSLFPRQSGLGLNPLVLREW
jgi:hypothetical protein